jgi:hypothetical protein
MKYLFIHIKSFYLYIYEKFDIIGYPEITSYKGEIMKPPVSTSKPVETLVKVNVLNLTHSTLGTVKKDDGWYVTELRYNPDTSEIGTPNYIKAGLERGSAIELFKKMSVTLNIVG